MPNAYSIRASEASDREGVIRIGEQILRDGTVFPFEEMSGIVGYWFADNTRVFVAVLEDQRDRQQRDRQQRDRQQQLGDRGVVHQIVGTYALKPNLPGRGDHVANAGYMVHEDYRGRGIGRALAEHSIATARALGFEAMQYNHVVATNESAMRLWHSLGFQEVGRVPASFRHPTQGKVATCILYRPL